MEKCYFYKGGKKYGPFNEEQLKRMAAERTIGPETLILTGNGEKRRAKLILGLFPETLPQETPAGMSAAGDSPYAPEFSHEEAANSAYGDQGFADNARNLQTQSNHQTTDTSAELYCPHCGFPLKQGSILCDNCKQPLTYCTSCGHIVNADAVACLSCGVPPKAGREFCHNCGTRHKPEQIICLVCGCSLNRPVDEMILPNHSKNRIVAAVLALCLGGLGVQKFYMGSWGWGIIYVVVGIATWGIATGIASLVEGIMLLCMSDKKFAAKYPPETENPMRW